MSEFLEAELGGFLLPYFAGAPFDRKQRCFPGSFISLMDQLHNFL